MLKTNFHGLSKVPSWLRPFAPIVAGRVACVPKLWVLITETSVVQQLFILAPVAELLQKERGGGVARAHGPQGKLAIGGTVGSCALLVTASEHLGVRQGFKEPLSF